MKKHDFDDFDFELIYRGMKKSLLAARKISGIEKDEIQLRASQIDELIEMNKSLNSELIRIRNTFTPYGE